MFKNASYIYRDRFSPGARFSMYHLIILASVLLTSTPLKYTENYFRF